MGFFSWLRTFFGHLFRPHPGPGRQGERDDEEEEEIEELVALDII